MRISVFSRIVLLEHYAVLEDVFLMLKLAHVMKIKIALINA